MSQGLDRLAIADRLREMAGLVRLEGGAPYRARAYEQGARVLEALDADLGPLIESGRLTELPGIGPGLAAVISRLQATGRAEAIEAQRARLPRGAAALSRIPGLSLRTIAALDRDLGIDTIEDLEAACRSGRVRSVKGIGPKTQRRILEAIQRMRAPAGPRRVLLPQAEEAARAILARVLGAPGVVAAEAAGDLRRSVETVDRLVLIAASSDPGRAAERAFASPLVGGIASRGDMGGHAVLVSGLPLELRVVPPARYAVALAHATGSAAHLERLRAAARAVSLRLTEEGLFKGPVCQPVNTEAELYHRLGLGFVPPELREDTGEIEAAREGRAADDLVTMDDIAGVVHCHTDYSDGRHTVAQMAQAADRLGMRYLTITDHSPTASYAGGLSVDRLRRQWDEIARVQETVRVRLLRGTESDILADGALDYPDAVLEQLDIVIASIHARHRMDEDAMTRRLVRAMRQPVFKVWGHALGRLLLSRPPIACRVEEVLDAVAASRAAVEINSDPRRLDLAPEWVRLARRKRLRFVISTDAHAVGELGNLRYGVAMARRGGVQRGEVLNTLDAEAFAAAVSPAGRR